MKRQRRRNGIGHCKPGHPIHLERTFRNTKNQRYTHSTARKGKGFEGRRRQVQKPHVGKCEENKDGKKAMHTVQCQQA